MIAARKRKPTKLVFIPLRIILGLFIFVVLFNLFGCQSGFLYHPQAASTEALAQMAQTRQLNPWLNAGGERIGWYREGSQGGPTVLVLHGNAGHAMHRSVYMEALQMAAINRRTPEPSVFIVEYPGYGDRPGRPSERNFQQAAMEAWKTLGDRVEGGVFILGESIGSGPTSWLAAKKPDQVDGLLLITPFDRLGNVVQHHGTLFGRLLISERYDNQTHLESFNGRLAVILAEFDRVVPARYGQALYDTFEGEAKRVWLQEGVDHNDLDLSPGASWWKEVWGFLTEE